MSVTAWIVVGVSVWLVIALSVAVVVGRVVARRDRQIPREPAPHVTPTSATTPKDKHR